MHAIAPAPGGGIYAATSPDGKIYKVDAAGKGTVFFDPPDKYIWSLAVDRAGNVFAGTGDKGVIYKIAPDGSGAPFYQTKATHVMSLAFDREGRLLAGTESPGRVFQIDAVGQAVRAARLALQRDPHAARRRQRQHLRGGGERPRRAAPDRARSGAGACPGAAADRVGLDRSHLDHHRGRCRRRLGRRARPAGRAARKPGARRRRGLSHHAGRRLGSRVAARAKTRRTTSRSSPTAASSSPPATRARSTGSSGDPLQPTLVARAHRPAGDDAPARSQRAHALCHVEPGQGAPAVGRRARTAAPTRRTCATRSRWPRGARSSGRRRRPPGTTRRDLHAVGQHADARRNLERLEQRLRRPGRQPDRESARALPAVARRAERRRATEAPLLTSVTAAYLPRNTRPRVTSITIHPPGTVFQRPFPTGDPEIAGFEGDTPDRRAASLNAGSGAVTNSPALGRRAYQKGLLTFVWRAEDDNRDELHLRRALPPRRRDHLEAAEARAHRPDPRVGHDLGAERPLHGAGLRVGLAVEPAGRRR